MNYVVLNNQITRHIMLIACTIALAVGLMLSLSQSAQAQTVTPPPVPQQIQVPEGNEAYLVGHATGTQNYVCSPCDPTKPNCPLGVAFSLFTPEATLFDDEGEQIITHFFSPNPVENGIIRATWVDSRDTSTVWASAVNSVILREGSIPWVLLNVKDTGTQVGPTGGDRLTKTTFIQRVRTAGGVAPSADCLSSWTLDVRRLCLTELITFSTRRAEATTRIRVLAPWKNRTAHLFGSLRSTQRFIDSEEL
jgi:hypothetical protein